MFIADYGESFASLITPFVPATIKEPRAGSANDKPRPNPTPMQIQSFLT